MSGDARITGRISITPPITKNELAGNRWAFMPGSSDALVRLNCSRDDLTFADPSAPVGVAIAPEGGETSARTLVEDVNRIVATFRAAPDGAPRTFGGWLHVVWGGGEAVYRVHVVNGRVVEAEPVVTWPAGARDEDGAHV